MAYQVIARKYRPQRFSDVVGQEHVTQTLSNAIEQKRIAHAYLFVGPRGTGKTTLARIFAKCLNCTGGPRVDWPDDDPRCQEITEGRALDVLEIDGASNRGIEEIRELRETVKYSPATSKFKIYIIDEVHMLTKEAFNALLKTLEEPPEHVKFMFATTEPEKVLPTILSRCQRFDLRRIPAALIAKHLAYIAGLEKVQIDEAALYAIARGAEGGMRDAESALDQLISFCGNDIKESDVLSMFGLTARSQILGLAQSVIAGDAAGALREFNQLSRTGKDLGRLMGDLLNHFRNLLLFQVSGGDLRLLEISEMEITSMKEQTAGLNLESLSQILDVLTEYEGRLRYAASKNILMEVALLKAIQARNAVPIDTVLRRLQELRGDGGGVSGAASVGAGGLSTVPVAKREQGTTVPRPAEARTGSVVQEVAPMERTPANRPAAATGASETGEEGASVAPETGGDAVVPENYEGLVRLWGQVLEGVGRASPFAKTYLLEAHPVSFVRKIFTIGFDPEFADHLGLVDNAKNRTLIQTKLKELGYPDTQVKFVKAEPPGGWRERKEAPGAEPAPGPAGGRNKPEVPADAPMSGESAPSSNQVATGNQAGTQATLKAASGAKGTAGPMSKDDFKDDPLIRQALEIFKGTIVEVRA